ncbi:hypothetical protein [Neisseria lactamica]|uniref:hypothetical protein n=1 Tax=Neisseria lactamica TaxID=486 RepID=UPI001863D16F|nr:hypothetical protein [Neisseria lactamica]
MPTGLDSRLRENDDGRSWWDWRKRWDWWAEAHPTAHSMPTLHICPAPVNGKCIKNAV